MPTLISKKTPERSKRGKYTIMTDFDRSKIAYKYDVEAKNAEVIACELLFKPSTVRSIIKRIDQTGSANIRKRGGDRRSLLNDEQKEKIRYYLDTENLSLPSIKRKLVDEYKELESVSLTTFNRAVKSFKFSVKRVKRIPEKRNDPG